MNENRTVGWVAIGSAASSLILVIITFLQAGTISNQQRVADKLGRTVAALQEQVRQLGAEPVALPEDTPPPAPASTPPPSSPAPAPAPVPEAPPTTTTTRPPECATRLAGLCL